MTRLVKVTGMVICAAGVLLAMAIAGHCASLFYDNFEPPVNMGLWTLGPSTGSWAIAPGYYHDPLHDQNNHIRTPGIKGIRCESNWHDIMNNKHALGASYGSNIYLKGWIYEDNDIYWPPTDNEFWPNGYITLLNSTEADACMIGVMGQIGQENGGLRDFYDNCCVYTTTDGPQVLNGDGVPLVPRRQGWRKYTILVNGYTASPGDVQFLIDDKLVYNGLRTGAAFDTIVLGAKRMSYATYYYDQVDFGTIDAAVPCGTVSDANALPDDTWVSLASKVVSGCFSYSDLPQSSPTAYDKPSPGYLAIEEDNRSAGLWVSSSYQANVVAATNLGERIDVRGIMRTNEAGMRYLDAIEITHAANPVSQPRILGTNLANVGSPLLSGKLVKVWGKVVNIPGSSPATVRGQERTGDWRRYFLIDDGSPGGPVKCYYGNIIAAKPGVDPVPAVANGNYVSVVGVAGREVLVPGTTSPEKSVWIRGAGDLIIVAP